MKACRCGSSRGLATFTPAIIEYFQSRSTKIAEDVREETEEQLRASLSQGVLAGETTFELRARVESVMGSASTMRDDRIARTEVARAQGYGDIQAWSQSGVVQGKEWYTAQDEHDCPFCNALDGKVFGLTENIFFGVLADEPSPAPWRLSIDYYRLK